MRQVAITTAKVVVRNIPAHGTEKLFRHMKLIFSKLTNVLIHEPGEKQLGIIYSST
jgi:hypothetical protein